jgi:type VI secretion system secreted protein VgrG
MTSSYALELEGFDGPISVLSLDGKEALSKSYKFRIVVRVAAGAPDLERVALGARAELTFKIYPSMVRAFSGLIASVRLLGRRERDACDYELSLVPRLWLLKKQRRTRVFQNLRVIDVVAAVLGEAGIASRWQLQHSYPVREYCTQYEETDYQFVTRLLAEAGIFFYFHQGAPGGFQAGAAAVLSGVSTLAAQAARLAAAMGPLVSGDSILCADDASFYPALGDESAGALAMLSALPMPSVVDGSAEALAAKALIVKTVSELLERDAPRLHYLELEQASETLSDKITAFELRNSVEPSVATFREYDPERPHTPLQSRAISNTPFGNDGLEGLASAVASALDVTVDAAVSVPGVGTVSASGALGAVKNVSGAGGPTFLEVYDHHAQTLFPKWSYSSGEAARMLRQERRRASVIRGRSGCSDLGPGRRFHLDGHPVARLEHDFALISVHHRGRNLADGSSAHRVYECEFECVPANVSYPPPRPKRKSVQVCLTATVVGPQASEIHVDSRGQIKVQFHWDREGTRDDSSSCWIRTMQPWAGSHWGVQFIPRVGMEVVVMFEGGDPDKPIVTGTVANAIHPVPFKLPEQKTRSGFRTSSSPGGKGANELSFEDAAGEEQVLLIAQRDLDEQVGRDHTLTVNNDERLTILGNRLDTVERNLAQIVKGDRSDQVFGNRLEAVSGSADERITGARTSRVEGKLQHDNHGDVLVTAEADVTLRALGSVTTVVGQADKPRSWITHAEGVASLIGVKRLELASDQELVLRVGESTLRMTGDQIELSAATVNVKGSGTGFIATEDGLSIVSKGDAQLLVDKKLVVKTKGASLALDQEVKIDGKKILLNSPDKAEDPPPPEPPPPTEIVLLAEDGAPLGKQRFLLTLDDESQQSGMTGEDGKVTLELDQDGWVIFPELTMRGDETEGSAQPYVIRQGDFLDKLAFRHGFDAEKVWNDGKNADLKAKRKDPNQLAPGDVLHFARSSKKQYPLTHGTSNEYRATIPLVKTRLVFTDARKPFAGEQYTVEGLLQPLSGKADNSGVLELELPIHVREVRVVFPKRGQVFLVRVGDVDPVAENSGVKARLAHLGYLRAGGPVEFVSDDGLEAAIRQFRRDQGLPASGEIDDALRAALEKAHGS